MRTILITLLVISAFMVCDSVQAQGFMVKPMRIEMAGTPGQQVQVDLQINNTSADKAPEVLVGKWYLDQGNNGSYQPLATDEVPSERKQMMQSCFDWMTVSENTLIVPPLQQGLVTVSVRIPSDATGTYSALLTVENVPERRPGTIGMVMRFVVPVIVDVRGRSARTEIDLAGVSLNYVESEQNASGESTPAVDNLHVSVANEGKIRGKVSGDVTILRKAGTGWRQVTVVEFPEKTVMPGTSWDFVQPSPRRLASGTYRLSTNFLLDGRKMRPMNEIVEYKGDPSVTTVQEDVSLMIEPRVAEIEGVPGARRTARIRIQNPSEQQLSVSISSMTPKTLQGVAMGDVKGEEYACNEWLNPNPAEFTLRGGGERTVAVRVSFPEENSDKPFHYGSLVITATYANGETASSEEVLVVAKNRELEAAPHLYPYTVSISQVEGKQYAVSGKFGNVGNVHLYPTCRATLSNTSGTQVFKQADLNADMDLVLPMGTPVYNGVLDLDGVNDGTYKLTVAATYGEHVANKDLALRVTTNGNGKQVEVLD